MKETLLRKGGKTKRLTALKDYYGYCALTHKHDSESLSIVLKEIEILEETLCNLLRSE